MKKFVLFLKKIYVLLLFIALEAAAIDFYSDSTTYTRARMLAASNAVFGGVYTRIAQVGDYFGLRRENRMLLEQLAEAHDRLEKYKALHPGIDTTMYWGESDIAAFHWMAAGVVRNSVARPENFITLDRGARDGVRRDMAVITPEGAVVGYVSETSDRFAVGMSVLNTNFRTGGRIKGSNYYGSVWWDGVDHRYVTLSEIPKYAALAAGDTVVTDLSSRFPPDVTVGTVEDFEVNLSSYYDVRVRLAAPMSSVGRVLLVDYADYVERTMLEERATAADSLQH